MITGKIAAILGGAALLAVASPAAAQASCSRELLQSMADKYVQAQEEGLPLRLPMGNWMVYRENFKLSTMSQGVISTELPISWHRALLDTTQCRVFLEMVSHEAEKPRVIAVQFGVRGDSANNIDAIVTDADDWLFDAAKTYEYARREDWSEIPEARRNTREELIAAADAYLDLFSDKSVQVPWGTPCARLEGSAYTAKGTPQDSCNVGVPENIAMKDRSYVVDETIGAIAVFLKMGPNERPDSHLFRVENGKLRFIHTVTDCGTEVNCGFGPFKEMLARNPGIHPEIKE